MVVEPRMAVKRFASEMEAKLAENDDDKDGWDGEAFGFLFGRLEEEVAELRAAMMMPDADHEKDCEVVRECADVANLAMMIADKRMGPHEDRGRALAGKGEQGDPDGGQKGLYAREGQSDHPGPGKEEQGG